MVFQCPHDSTITPESCPNRYFCHHYLLYLCLDKPRHCMKIIFLIAESISIFKNIDGLPVAQQNNHEFLRTVTSTSSIVASTSSFVTSTSSHGDRHMIRLIGTRTLFYFFCLLFYSCILNFLPIIPILCPIILEIQSTFYITMIIIIRVMIACYTVPSMMLRYSRSANSAAGYQKYCSE